MVKFMACRHTISWPVPALTIYLFLWFLLRYLKDICSTLVFIVFCFILRAAITSEASKTHIKDGRGYKGWHPGTVL